MNKIIYLDAAASQLKPASVLQAEVDFLQNNYANAGRGICARAAAADQMVTDGRNRVATLINASPDQIVFTSGSTDGLNRVLRILEASSAFTDKSCVVVSNLDHHSARLPWEGLAAAGKCQIDVCPLDKDFNLDINNMPRADILIVTAMSNVLGTPQDVQKLIQAARVKNPDVITIVDAAQYVAHLPIDVRTWGCDFMCFSGHKIGADTGLGILYIKDPARWAVDKLGGGMVARVTEKTWDPACGARSEWTYAEGAARFEAGTLPLTQIAGLPAAIEALGEKSEAPKIMAYLRSELLKMDQIRVLSAPGASILTFVIRGMHCLDFGSLIGAYGVCVRVGNMCASWMHKALGVPGTIRISAGPWNTMDQAHEVVAIIKKIIEEKADHK